MGGCQSPPQKAAGLRAGTPCSPPPAADHHTPDCTCVRPRRLRSGGGGTAAHRQERPPHPNQHRLTSPQLLCVCEKEQGPRQARSTSGAIKAASGGGLRSTFTPHPPIPSPEQLRNTLTSLRRTLIHVQLTKRRVLPPLWGGEIIQHEQSNKKKKSSNREAALTVISC